MWTISLIKAVRFCLKHVPCRRLKKTLYAILEIYEQNLLEEKTVYDEIVAEFLANLKQAEKEYEKAKR